MENKETSLLTRFKILAGLVLMVMGIIFLFTPNLLQATILVTFGNLLHLDGRVSKLEEENESSRK